jgi:hypothetical protein
MQLLPQFTHFQTAQLLSFDYLGSISLAVSLQVVNGVLVVGSLFVEFVQHCVNFTASLIQILLQPCVLELHLLQIVEMDSLESLDVLLVVDLEFGLKRIQFLDAICLTVGEFISQLLPLLLQLQDLVVCLSTDPLELVDVV